MALGIAKCIRLRTRQGPRCLNKTLHFESVANENACRLGVPDSFCSASRLCICPDRQLQAVGKESDGMCKGAQGPIGGTQACATAQSGTLSGIAARAAATAPSLTSAHSTFATFGACQSCLTSGYDKLRRGRLLGQQCKSLQPWCRKCLSGSCRKTLSPCGNNDAMFLRAWRVWLNAYGDNVPASKGEKEAGSKRSYHLLLYQVSRIKSRLGQGCTI